MPPPSDGNSPARAARNETVAQPHTGSVGPGAEAERAAARLPSDGSRSEPSGGPVSRRSPFLIGMTGAAGVAVAAGCVELILVTRDALVLIGLALFIAIGLEPAVAWQIRRGLSRWAAVTLVSVGSLSLILGFFAAVVPPVVAQGRTFASQAPAYLQALQDHNSVIGRLNERFHLQQSLNEMLNGGPANIINGMVGAGAIVFNALASTVAVTVLTVYFLASFPQVHSALYRLVPNSRRPRAILIGERIFEQVGAYVLGNVIVSLIAGILTLTWLLIFGVPYPLLLAIMVALLDLIPVVGSTVAGVVVCLVALTVSVPVAVATAVFFVLYRFLEDYLLFPKIIGRVVDIPGLVTVVAVFLGGAIFGVLGALVAIPIAAAALLIVREVLLPRLDQA